MSENEEFIREFLEESEENLDQLDQDLVALEGEPRDTKRLENIFRTIHTIKGTSGFFGFSKLGALAHDGESLLGRLRDGQLILNQEIATALLQLIDAIREMLDCIGDSGNEGSASYQALSASLIRLALSSSSEEVTKQIDAEEKKDSVADETSQGDSTDIRQSSATSFETESAVEELPSAKSTAREPTTVPEPAQPMEPTTPVATKPPVDSPPTEKIGIASEGSIRVDVRLLDDLMDLAGELVLARNQLNQFSSALEDIALVKTIQQLGAITSELQAGVMQTRMQPISTIWGKFPRVIRDLALACGKEIALELEGEDTELDRSLLEAIKDPLTHLLRNAVDHGIELSETRKSLGKPAKGRILLRAYHEGGQVNIEIIDDGAGIDVDRVKQKALAHGLIDAQQAATMTDHELVQMIFQPGFSTAEKVTDVSGRGVGMDVVQTNIEKIGGTINLQNYLGQGTTVQITIPLTLAIIPALVITVGGGRFAIPQVNLIELLNFGKEESGRQIEWINDTPVCRLRGNLLPLVYLNQTLELDHESNKRGSGTNIVVLRAEGRQFGVVVDQVINTEEIVVKPLGKAIKSIAVFAGATIMGDGTVALILDSVGLARKAGFKLAKSDLAPVADQPDETPVASQPFLVCEGDERCRIAIRLNDVQRLENFPAEIVQQTTAAETVEYYGEIMPLVRLSKLLNWSDNETRNNDSLSVIVHRQSGRSAGLVVPRIVDIVGCTQEIQQRPDERGLVIGSSIIEGRVTDVIDLPVAFQLAGIHFAQRVGDSTG